MANFTDNLNLKKPLQTEFYNVDDFNENADIIDENLWEAMKHCENYSNPHKTTADSVKASKMFTSGEINTYTTLLDACNALKYGGGFVVSSVSPICTADDYPEKGYEFAFYVACEANEARKAVIAYMYHGSKMNVFQRNIFNGAWETAWKSTDESYLSLSGGTLTGGLGINGGIASFGAIEQYLSLAHKEAPESNNYRNFSISNGAEVEDSLILHEVRNGDEVAAYRIFGEHNIKALGFSQTATGNYGGGGGYGEQNAIIINMDIIPSILILGALSETGGTDSTKGGRIGIVQYGSHEMPTFSNGGTSECYVEWTETATGGCTAKIWSTTNAAHGFNTTGVTYQWNAFR